MARTYRDVEAYLQALGKSWEKLDDGMYVIGARHDTPIALRLVEGLLVARALIGDPPAGDLARQAEVYQRLLELNATELVYAAYGLDSGHMILSAAMDLENLDLNELESMLNDIDLALARHTAELRQMCQQA